MNVEYSDIPPLAKVSACNYTENVPGLVGEKRFWEDDLPGRGLRAVARTQAFRADARAIRRAEDVGLLDEEMRRVELCVDYMQRKYKDEGLLEETVERVRHYMNYILAQAAAASPTSKPVVLSKDGDGRRQPIWRRFEQGQRKANARHERRWRAGAGGLGDEQRQKGRAITRRLGEGVLEDMVSDLVAFTTLDMSRGRSLAIPKSPSTFYGLCVDESASVDGQVDCEVEVGTGRGKHSGNSIVDEIDGSSKEPHIEVGGRREDEAPFRIRTRVLFSD
ncbi:hypothetical protein DFH06DRAFT_1121782 [Mycena polygramma]|nr:hypothetical protein DFH06DRAFT_1121782 [Mycena polygramma]